MFTSDRSLRDLLNGIGLQEFIAEQRKSGRAALTEEFFATAADHNFQSLEILEDPRRGDGVKRLATFLRVITTSLAALHRDRKPTYYPYTELYVLDWYIGGTHRPFHELKLKAITGISHLLYDLLHFEAESLAGFQQIQQDSFSRDASLSRIDTIQEAVEAANFVYTSLASVAPLASDLVHYESLDGYTNETSRLSALVHFSCMPQTGFHDEVVFIRTLHVSEFCFFAIWVSIQEAIENIKAGAHAAATTALQQGIAFGKLLHRAFKVLRTMTPEHFQDFRDYTGHASAIQSRNYQLMEVYLRGFNPAKRHQFAAIPHLHEISRYYHPNFIHLGGAIKAATIAASSAEDESLLAAAKALDRQLLTCRGLHLSFALNYLPQDIRGTGDTEGAGYLQHHLKSSLFDDTTVDWEVIREIFGDSPGLPDEFRIRVGERMVPDESYHNKRRRETAQGRARTPEVSEAASELEAANSKPTAPQPKEEGGDQE